MHLHLVEESKRACFESHVKCKRGRDPCKKKRTHLSTVSSFLLEEGRPSMSWGTPGRSRLGERTLGDPLRCSKGSSGPGRVPPRMCITSTKRRFTSWKGSSSFTWARRR